MTVPTPPQANTNQPSASSVISIAEAQIGQYSHTNKFNTWYGLPGTEWCDEFVSWCANQAGAGKAYGKFSWTVAHAKWFQSQGRWSASNPQAGDLVFFDWSGGKSISGIDHVGIVKGTSGSNVLTIEGNTGSDQVASRTRDPKFIVGFGTPNIAGLGNVTGVTPAGFSNPLGGLGDLVGAIENVTKHLTDPGFWKRVGLAGLAMLLIGIAIAFFNRKKIETVSGNVAKEAAIGAFV